MTAALDAFITSKSESVKPPVMNFLQPIGPKLIDADGPLYVFGVVPCHQQSKSKLKEWATTGYWRRTLNQAEQNFFATKREFLVVESSILSLLPYIAGTSFKVQTDHNALRWML